MKNTQKMALTGIMAAMTLLILFAANIIPNSKFFLLAAASLPVAVVVMECDYRYALLLYIATSALAFILLPNKLLALPYILVLGLYGIIKALAEKSNRIKEWVIKMLYFNITIGLYLYLVLKFFLTDIQFPIPLWVLWLGGNVAFVIYDIVYSFCISFYEKQIHPKIKHL